jgi:hypothetical protein
MSHDEKIGNKRNAVSVEFQRTQRQAAVQGLISVAFAHGKPLAPPLISFVKFSVQTANTLSVNFNVLLVDDVK